MDRRDLSSSHSIVKEHPEINTFLYPSCRAPDQGKCVVTYDIICLGFSPKSLNILSYSFNTKTNTCYVTSPVVPMKSLPLEISWAEIY